MSFSDYKWSSDTYAHFLSYLEGEVDHKYKDMSNNILKSDKKVIGNRIPLLRKIAKEISRGDYQSFIKLNPHKTFEETTIHGLVIGYLNTDIDTTITMLKDFTGYIDNWGTNDVVASSLKVFKKDQSKGFKYLKSLIKTNKPWLVRFGLIMMLSHYINDDYIDHILAIVGEVDIDHYYVKMGNAWLISMCYVKQKEKTTIFLKNNRLDYWTQNKAIQKIRESYQVSLFDKELVLSYKKARE